MLIHVYTCKAGPRLPKMSMPCTLESQFCSHLARKCLGFTEGVFHVECKPLCWNKTDIVFIGSLGNTDMLRHCCATRLCTNFARTFLCLKMNNFPMGFVLLFPRFPSASAAKGLVGDSGRRCEC